MLVLVGLLISCKRDLSPLEEVNYVRPLTLAEEQLVQSGRDFGLKLFAAISEAQPDTNLFISPLSVSMAFGMALNGAEGETYEAIRNTLELDGLTREQINKNYRSLIQLLVSIDPQVIFENANSIWYRQDFSVLPSFIENNQKYFQADVEALDFSLPSAVDIINGWVTQKTHHKITQILDVIPKEAVLYLINAIYFKALWQYQFDKKYTAEQPFYITPARSITCSMMKITAELGYYQDEQVQVVDLPYGNGSFSMTALLPANDYALDDLITNLQQDEWNQYLQSMQTKKGTVALPKFTMEYFTGLKEILGSMGMAVAFSLDADFSRINPDEQIFITRALHKTFVKTDEEGTEAAAVTVVEFSRTSVGEDVDFYVTFNRPFIFIIREKHSGTILFIGKMVKPEWN